MALHPPPPPTPTPLEFFITQFLRQMLKAPPLNPRALAFSVLQYLLAVEHFRVIIKQLLEKDGEDEVSFFE